MPHSLTRPLTLTLTCTLSYTLLYTYLYDHLCKQLFQRRLLVEPIALISSYPARPATTAGIVLPGWPKVLAPSLTASAASVRPKRRPRCRPSAPERARCRHKHNMRKKPAWQNWALPPTTSDCTKPECLFSLFLVLFFPDPDSVLFL